MWKAGASLEGLSLVERVIMKYEDLKEQAEQFELKQRERFRILMDSDEDLLDEDRYPTDKACELIELWNYSDVDGWFKFIESLWYFRDFGWYSEQKDGDTWYYISTAGWSGNESLIGAMKSNMILWSTTWESSRRGGHYEFRVEHN